MTCGDATSVMMNPKRETLFFFSWPSAKTTCKNNLCNLYFFFDGDCGLACSFAPLHSNGDSCCSSSSFIFCISSCGSTVLGSNAVLWLVTSSTVADAETRSLYGFHAFLPVSSSVTDPFPSFVCWFAPHRTDDVCSVRARAKHSWLNRDDGIIVTFTGVFCIARKKRVLKCVCHLWHLCLSERNMKHQRHFVVLIFHSIRRRHGGPQLRIRSIGRDRSLSKSHFSFATWWVQVCWYAPPATAVAARSGWNSAARLWWNELQVYWAITANE